MNIPDTMTAQALWSTDQQFAFLNNHAGLKTFKIVNDGKGKRKLVAYFETWEALHKALNTKPVWQGTALVWRKHTSPTLRKRQKKSPSSKPSAGLTPGKTFADVVKSSDKSNPKVKKGSQKSNQGKSPVDKLRSILQEVLRTL